MGGSGPDFCVHCIKNLNPQFLSVLQAVKVGRLGFVAPVSYTLTTATVDRKVDGVQYHSSLVNILKASVFGVVCLSVCLSVRVTPLCVAVYIIGHTGKRKQKVRASV